MTTETTTDADFLAAFESCTLPADTFHHQDHVRMAWVYLQRLPVLDALARFVTALQRYAAHHGAPQRYHATITLAYFFLIAERRERHPEVDSWEEFAAANADLLRWRGGLVERCYRPETLASDLARRVFLLPEREIRPDAAP